MKDSVDKMVTSPLTRKRQHEDEDDCTTNEVRELRALLGMANWVATQGRPDLSFLTSFIQGTMPHPKVKDQKMTNVLVRTARQFSDTLLLIKAAAKTRFLLYTDASWGNTAKGDSQGGQVVAAVHEDIFDNRIR